MTDAQLITELREVSAEIKAFVRQFRIVYGLAEDYDDNQARSKNTGRWILTVSEAEVLEFIDLKPANNNKAVYEMDPVDKAKAIQAAKWFIDNTAKYTQRNPLVSSTGDKIHFQPNEKAYGRLNKKQTYIENALHFITNRNSGNFNTRYLDRSKLDTIQDILEVAKNPDERIVRSDGTLFYWKELKGNKRKSETIILHVDKNGMVENIYRAAGSMPGKKLENVKKMLKRER
jgi:hypothetical protein